MTKELFIVISFFFFPLIDNLIKFLVADAQLYKRLCPSVGWLVGRFMVIELESVKTRISAPAHPSATGIGRVSGLVSQILLNTLILPFHV